jgi:hypothetical protein
MPFELSVLLWPFFWLGIVVTAGYAFALLFHWFRFGFMYPLVWLALPVYAAGVFIFIGAMLTGIIAI